MNKKSLNGQWFVSNTKIEKIAAQVPGCIHTDLLANGLINDPYFRDNESMQMWVGEMGWTYQRSFSVDEEFLSHKHIELVCYGLDTFCQISINDIEVAKTNNMFRTWKFDIGKFLVKGTNTISLIFSPTFEYINKKIDERFLLATGTKSYRLTGSNYVRKSQCNYGWDWGPKCVTCGIWRDIELLAYSDAKINNVHIKQQHNEGIVNLNLTTFLDHYENQLLKLHVTVSYANEVVAEVMCTVENELTSANIEIENPNLWWPNNLGEQCLYDVNIKLINEEDSIVDKHYTRIGLRTLTLDRHKDKWGESFQFVVNDIAFFAKGANWIPIDTFVTRGTDDFYKQILTDAKDANMNFIRVWGGGIYEQNIFYELCDELGLCVWQDFMFACSAYPSYDKEFMSTFKQEAIDNIIRLRSHPCIALWCGNNELEHMGNLISNKADESNGTMSWDEYKLLFEDTIPSLIKRYDSEHDYWVSSSHTPGENRTDPNNPTKGDAHLWEVWHGRKPFEWYRTCEHRFNSEFGFQSFPQPSVVYSFTKEEDRNITSFIMEKHQRSDIGNDAILQYMLSWFKLPTSFDMLLWTSQILQSLAIKYAVEHWRRKMPQGMGTLYWQLNDCWPVASWSSIDYVGNWKALHYSAKKFNNPLLISGLEDNENLSVDIYLSNDTKDNVYGTISFQLLNLNGTLEAEGSFNASIESNKSRMIRKLNLSEYVNKAGGKRNVVLFYSYEVGGKIISENTTYFTRPKHLHLCNPKYSVLIKHLGDKEYSLTISADKPSLWVWVEFENIQAKFSDNFFDLDGLNEKTIIFHTQDTIPIDKLKHTLILNSIVDTYSMQC